MAKVRQFLKRVWKLLLRIGMWFLALSILLVIIYKWVPVPGTPLMLIRYIENLAAGKDARIVKEWVPLEQISPHLHLAVVASEDQNFLKHYGIDFGAIEKAMKENKTRENPRGASTITQQTAKNVFLWPGKNYLRKGLEVYFTYLIEFIWGKERILEVYLNVIEMGNGIYGAEAASRQYFKKSAAALTPAQAALLAAVLPRPLKYAVVNPSSYMRKRQGQIQKQMRLFGGRLRWEKRDETSKK